MRKALGGAYHQRATTLGIGCDVFHAYIDVDGDAQPFDLRPQNTGGHRIELTHHQAWGAFEDADVQSAISKSFGQFQPEQTTTDDDHPATTFGQGGDGGDIRDGAVGEHTWEFRPWCRWQERTRTGGKYCLRITAFAQRGLHQIALRLHR